MPGSSDPRFDAIQSHPANEIFHVVFFPDRIYHAEYLNATRSARYRYNVLEVRSKSSANVLKGEVYLDENKISNFVRVEYRSEKLIEVARQKGRFVGREVVVWVKLIAEGKDPVEARVPLTYCPWVDAYQCEIWQTLEPPANTTHDYKVLDLMGHCGAITRVPNFSPVLADLRSIQCVELAFREGRYNYPSGYSITDADSAWDNYFGRNIQVPNVPDPSDGRNTVLVENYRVDFRRGWYVSDVHDIDPVRYRNAMMMDAGAQEFCKLFFDNDMQKMNEKNVIEMRWALQQELGSELVFFHHVTIPPHCVEGTHQHIGSEELYFVTEGEGLAYMSENDDPYLAKDERYPIVELPIFGLDNRRMKEVPVKAGSIIFTKSGGMHGIRNPNNKPLKFVAFLYHSH
jgi:mannose-6-phosphate isomerase-like protein (cupin superfamily)